MIEIGSNLKDVLEVALVVVLLIGWPSFIRWPSKPSRKRQEATPPKAKGSTPPRRVICAMCNKEGPDGNKCSHCGVPFLWSWRGPNPHA